MYVLIYNNSSNGARVLNKYDCHSIVTLEIMIEERKMYLVERIKNLKSSVITNQPSDEIKKKEQSLKDRIETRLSEIKLKTGSNLCFKKISDSSEHRYLVAPKEGTEYCSANEYENLCYEIVEKLENVVDEPSRVHDIYRSNWRDSRNMNGETYTTGDHKLDDYYQKHYSDYYMNISNEATNPLDKNVRIIPLPHKNAIKAFRKLEKKDNKKWPVRNHLKDAFHSNEWYESFNKPTLVEIIKNIF